MIEIQTSGVIESTDQLAQLMDSHRQIVLPAENDDLELTHWWVITDDGAEVLYVGTPDTFTTFIEERNGGIH